MLSSSVDFAAAANAFPAPFVQSGTANVAVVWGGVDTALTQDLSAAQNIANALKAATSSSGGSASDVLSIGDESWQAKTSSDDLELSETLAQIETYLDSSNLEGLLADGEISNEKGDAGYSQYLYLDETDGKVTFTEDDDDNVGLFYKVLSGDVIARYLLDFNTNLESDIDSDDTLSDIKDERITILGKEYTITGATNSSGGVKLTLLSGAVHGVATPDAQTFGAYEVSASITSSTQVKFTVNGQQTDKLGIGDLEKLADGNYLSVADIDYESFAEGARSAEFYIGADKLEMNNGTSLKVNAETIDNAAVRISSTESGGDISIQDISVNMTAEDDLYVPVGGKLSESADLDEPQVLLTQGWDIVFNGLDTATYEEIKLKTASSDKRYALEFQNADGDEISLPVVFANATGLFGGEEKGKELILNASTSIAKNQYFILNTRAPATASNDAKSFVVQYKGADAVGDTDPKVKFDVLGIDSSKEVTLDSAGTFDLKVGGSTFSFRNISADTSDDFKIQLNAVDVGYLSADGEAGWAQLRTKNNALIIINDTNVTAGIGNGLAASASWKISVFADDTDRDDDTVPLPEKVFSLIVSNTSAGEVDSSSIATNITVKENPDNDDEDLAIINYGADISIVDTSDSPAQITAKIPESIVNPLVYVVASSSVGGSTGNLVPITDSEAATMTSKNIVVVGGSCVNTIAAQLLGSSTPLCGAAFTAASGASVGAGEYLIATYAWGTNTVATLVAGYNAVDTTAAATALTTQSTIDLSSGKKYKGSTASASSIALV